MSFFFTLIANQRRKVTVRDSNVKPSDLMDFQTLGLNAYLVPIERFCNLRRNGDGYVATSIIPKSVKLKPIVVAVPEVEEKEEVVPEPKIEKCCITIIEEDKIQLPEIKRRRVMHPKSVTISRDAISKFQHTMTPVYSNIHEAVGKEIYSNDKKRWIEEFGNDSLKYAFEHGIECDCGYVVQRASVEFPGFEICSEYRHDVIDTPDIELVRFVLEEALDERQTCIIKRYRNRISFHSNSEDPHNPIVNIKNYLFRCDLVIPLKKMVTMVCECQEN